MWGGTLSTPPQKPPGAPARLRQQMIYETPVAPANLIVINADSTWPHKHLWLLLPIDQTRLVKHTTYRLFAQGSYVAAQASLPIEINRQTRLMKHTLDLRLPRIAHGRTSILSIETNRQRDS